jgi:hypothetical protein
VTADETAREIAFAFGLGSMRLTGPAKGLRCSLCHHELRDGDMVRLPKYARGLGVAHSFCAKTMLRPAQKPEPPEPEAADPRQMGLFPRRKLAAKRKR